MILSHVPLEQIDDNPFQPRRDYPAIEGFADQILAAKESYPDTAGLIHIPMGRVVDEAGTMIPGESPEGAHRIQIAAGHRRLRAFQHLAKTDPDYSLFPIILADLDDGEMAKTAWRENEQRTDLTPMDEARSFEFMRDSLHWRHVEIAGALGLGRATVSNKLRLLQFPDWVQDMIHDLTLPERTARAALPLLQLPDQLKKRTFVGVDDKIRSAREMTTEVEESIGRVSQDLGLATWDPLDMWTPQPDESYIIKIDGKDVVPGRDTQACANCPERKKIAGKERCLKPLCYLAKMRAWTAETAGPEEAKALYKRFSTWIRNKVDVNDYVPCAACDLKAKDLPLRSGWYHPISQTWTYVCPWCWSRAGLPVDPPQTPLTVVTGAPVDSERLENYTPPAPPAAPTPPRRPAPVLEPIAKPSYVFQATIMTVRIEAGDDDDRTVTVSMGDEAGPGRIDLNSIQMKTGTVHEILELIDSMIDVYFANNPD